VPVAGRECHDGVERLLEAAVVLAACAFRQAAMPPGAHDGAQQQRLQRGANTASPASTAKLQSRR
jgi:hypothetical protein